jgi:hypothetical protein
MLLLFLTASPGAFADDRQLLQANAGASADVLVILDSSHSMNRDFTDHFDLPAYMDDFIYPQGTAAATNGSKIGVAKSVLRQVMSTSQNVNWAFAYYRNPNQTFGAAATGPVGEAIGGAKVAGDTMENGGVEWLYFADTIDTSSPTNPGGSIDSVFNPNAPATWDFPDISQGRFLSFGHKVPHNYNREDTGEVADTRLPYTGAGFPGIPVPPQPVPGTFRGAQMTAG